MTSSHLGGVWSVPFLPQVDMQRSVDTGQGVTYCETSNAKQPDVPSFLLVIPFPSFLQ